MEHKPLNSVDIQAALTKKFYFQRNAKYVVDNMLVWAGFESDLVTISQANYVTEYEIKISKSDFKADFKKMERKWNYNTRSCVCKYKHDMLKAGESGLKYFYFVCPKDVIPLEDIPEYVGLIYIDRKDWGTSCRDRVKIIKKAPVLPNCKKWEIDKILNLLRKVMAKNAVRTARF